jgi:hypothetical protein
MGDAVAPFAKPIIGMWESTDKQRRAGAAARIGGVEDRQMADARNDPRGASKGSTNDEYWQRAPSRTGI